jgi:predicted dehydrogenase
MGSSHSRTFSSGKLAGAQLTAVADINPVRLEQARADLPGIATFVSHQDLVKSGLVDAIIIAVPHYDHPAVALDAFAAGLHVMCEKPLCVSVKAGRALIAEYEAKYQHLKFGIMFNQRTNTLYKKLRELIAAGEMGEIYRVTWLITDWFRSWAYYASGGWRATWAGEGGGVLINQCPHNLDLIQWITGMMPKRVIAHASVGKYHPIEVEDDVHATLLYENGAVGHFITTTGECPGSNRLEISGERGRIVVEDDKMTWKRTREKVQEYSRTTTQQFMGPERWDVQVPVAPQPADQHPEVLKAFVKTIVTGSPMTADGVEGIRGLELGNAIMMAGLTGKPVDLPVNGDEFDAFIEEMKKKYGGKKTLAVTESAAAADFSASFR